MRGQPRRGERGRLSGARDGATHATTPPAGTPFSAARRCGVSEGVAQSTGVAHAAVASMPGHARSRMRTRRAAANGLVRGAGRGPNGRESGSFLVLWSVAAVGLLMLAALAIDLGNVAQRKRQTQNAADAAVLAAVVDLAPAASGSESVAAAEAAAVAAAEHYLIANDPALGSSPNFDACAPMPSSVTPYPGADCFGFFASAGAPPPSAPNGMVVETPPQQVPFSLGRAGGLSGQGVSSIAEASIQTPGAGFLLPFGYSVAGSSGLQCLKTGSGNKAGSCQGFATGSGQFGILDSPRDLVFPASSPAAGNDAVVEADLDLGIDHRLVVWPSGTSIVCDALGPPPSCPAYGAPPAYEADAVAPLTGQTYTLPGPALFTGGFSLDGCTFEPRFTHPSGLTVTTSNCAEANPSAGPNGPYLTNDTFQSTYELNGVHISCYLVSGASSVTDVGSCPPPGDAPTQSSAYLTCYEPNGAPNPTSEPIDQGGIGSGNVWAAGDACFSSLLQSLASSDCASTVSCAPLFAGSIAASPRFGVVPVINTGNGGQASPILGFDGVYLDLAFGNGSKVDAMLAWVFPLWLIQPVSLGSGGGVGTYLGGPFVANLCSLSAPGPLGIASPTGNC
jgi:hypothetical protein